VPDIRKQLRDNLVAITSLVIALSALGYNTWRNELTERNRNIRVAGIELLNEIGSLQQIIFYAHFAEGDQRGDPRMGWADSAGLVDDDEAFRRIDGAIDVLRQTTLESLRALK